MITVKNKDVKQKVSLILVKNLNLTSDCRDEQDEHLGKKKLRELIPHGWKSLSSLGRNGTILGCHELTLYVTKLQSEARITDNFCPVFFDKCPLFWPFFNLSNTQFRKRSTNFGQMSVILGRKYARYFDFWQYNSLIWNGGHRHHSIKLGRRFSFPFRFLSLNPSTLKGWTEFSKNQKNLLIPTRLISTL